MTVPILSSVPESFDSFPVHGNIFAKIVGYEPVPWRTLVAMVDEDERDIHDAVKDLVRVGLVNLAPHGAYVTVEGCTVAEREDVQRIKRDSLTSRL